MAMIGYILQLMNNQICPWRSDSESHILDNQSLIFQSYSATKSSSTHHNPAKNRRPQSTEAYKSCKTQKKLIRPSSCKINTKILKKNRQQSEQQIKLHFFTQVDSPFRKSASSVISINQINFGTPGKTLKRNISAVYTGYSSFSKQKVKKADNPNAILSKQMMVLSRGKQKNSDDIYLNRRLASVLKLTKYAITSPVREQINRKSLVVKEEKVKEKQRQKQRQKQKQKKGELLKKAGFVYYNQSLMQNFQLKLS